MRPNIAKQTESNFGRRAIPAQTAGIVLAITLAVPAQPEYPQRWYDRAHLKPVTHVSAANTAAVATAFADATTDYERQVTARLLDLRAAAHEDQIPWSQDSADAANLFLSFFPKPHRPTIVLTNEGNLAAIWESGRDRHIALQFFGPYLVQYTLLSRRPGAHNRSTTSGRDTPNGVLQQIAALGLLDLLTA